jgi:NAD(P)-dependent dehydrogenase (short-subunit alcohol dehydrogenase family)
MSTRIVLVTGAAGCIGRAITGRFLQQGETVIALDIDRDALSALPERLGVVSERLLPVEADVTDEPLIKRKVDELAAEVGPVSVLVNNAGGNRTTLLGETTAADWRADIELNLNAAFYMCSAVVPHMLAQKSGCILNIGSVNGLSVYGDPGYSAAKAGLIHFTRLLATEYGRRGIRSNVICPGTVKTEAWAAMLKARPSLFEKLRDLCSLGDIAAPEDVASLVRFLASDEARMIHGSTLVIDGGLSAGIPSVMSAFTTHDVP